MGVPDLRFIMSLNVSKRREREKKMVTSAPSVEYVYIKQWSLFPSLFTSVIAFGRKHIF